MEGVRRLVSVAMAVLLGLAPLAAQINVAPGRTGALTATNTSCTATACVSMPVTSMTGAVAIQISGTFTATVTFEVTVDATNWVAAAVVPIGATRTLTTTATAAGSWQINVAGLKGVRARCSAFTSGTINVSITASEGTPGIGS